MAAYGTRIQQQADCDGIWMKEKKFFFRYYLIKWMRFVIEKRGEKKNVKL